ncbi:MAG: SLBB domain-containing protein [Verrucomicrobia bacterium]|jgi:protein involved in polysaccharide export with SLBB domain|nr:SLBB domain-containing protein [Verrucomicrobiota bacterium]
MRVDALTKKSKEAQNAQPEIIRFKILGQVNKPGFYEVPRDIGIDLLDAIAIAGGYEKLADDVTLKYTDEGKEKVETFKLRDLKKTPESQIPKLRTNATIIVGESIF